MAGLFSLWYDGFLSRAQKRQASWALHEEYRRLPLACVGGPLCTVSLFWLVSEAIYTQIFIYQHIYI